MLHRYVVHPVVNKEVTGFLEKNGLDDFKTDPTEGRKIEFMELRRPGFNFLNLNGWLDRFPGDREDFSLTIKYKNHAAIVLVYRNGVDEPDQKYYGPGPNIKERRLEYSGVYPESENVLYN